MRSQVQSPNEKKRPGPPQQAPANPPRRAWLILLAVLAANYLLARLINSYNFAWTTIT